MSDTRPPATQAATDDRRPDGPGEPGRQRRRSRGRPTDGVLVDEREGMAIVGRSFGRQTWDRFRRHRLAIFAVVLLVLHRGGVLGRPVVLPVGPLTPDAHRPSARDRPLEHPFGTDPIGRDLMVRTFVGGRFSLRIALIVALVTTAHRHGARRHRRATSAGRSTR